MIAVKLKEIEEKDTNVLQWGDAKAITETTGIVMAQHCCGVSSCWNSKLLK